MEEPPALRPATRNPLVYLFAALLVYTAILLLASIPAGTYALFSGNLSKTFDVNSWATPFLYVGPLFAPFPFSISVGADFAFLTAIYAIFLVYTLVQPASLRRAVGLASREGIGGVLSSPFVVVLVSTGFLVFGGNVIDSLVSAAGSPIGSLPTQDPLAALLGLTAAPLAEEFGFRGVLIGVVALILSVGKPSRRVLRALWRPSVAYEGLAVGSGTAVIIWAAVGFSSVTFGACHVVCGGSWDIGKFWEAAFGGVVLGFLYVKYGFHVAVLAHWGVDYFGSAYSFFGQAAYGIPWNSTTQEYIGQYLVDYDLLYLFGLASFLLVVYVGLRKFAEWRSRGPGSPPEALNSPLPEGPASS